MNLDDMLAQTEPKIKTLDEMLAETGAETPEQAGLRRQAAVEAMPSVQAAHERAVESSPSLPHWNTPNPYWEHFAEGVAAQGVEPELAAQFPTGQQPIDVTKIENPVGRGMAEVGADIAGALPGPLGSSAQKVFRTSLDEPGAGQRWGKPVQSLVKGIGEFAAGAAAGGIPGLFATGALESLGETGVPFTGQGAREDTKTIGKAAAMGAVAAFVLPALNSFAQKVGGKAFDAVAPKIAKSLAESPSARKVARELAAVGIADVPTTLAFLEAQGVKWRDYFKYEPGSPERDELNRQIALNFGGSIGARVGLGLGEALTHAARSKVSGEAGNAVPGASVEPLIPAEGVGANATQGIGEQAGVRPQPETIIEGQAPGEAGQGNRLLDTAQSATGATPPGTVAAPPVVSRETTPFKLPPELSKSAPSFNYGKRKVALDFESDYDKALYIVAGKKNLSKRDADFLSAMSEWSGMSESELRAHGQQVKLKLKQDIEADPIATTITVPKTGIGEQMKSQSVAPPRALGSLPAGYSAEPPKGAQPSGGRVVADIVRDTAKALNTPVLYKGVKKGSKGVYTSGMAFVDVVNDAPTAMHELGHSMDIKLDVLNHMSKEAEAQLAAFDPPHNGEKFAAYSSDPAALRRERLVWVLEHWFDKGPLAVAEKAPAAAAELNSLVPKEIASLLNEYHVELTKFRKDKRAINQSIRDPYEPSLWDTFMDSWKKKKERWVDNLSPLIEGARDIYKKAGLDQNTARDAVIRAQRAKGVASQQVIGEGQYSLDHTEFLGDSLAKRIESTMDLSDIPKEQHAQVIEDFKGYWKALHAADLENWQDGKGQFYENNANLEAELFTYRNGIAANSAETLTPALKAMAKDADEAVAKRGKALLDEWKGTEAEARRYRATGIGKGMDEPLAVAQRMIAHANESGLVPRFDATIAELHDWMNNVIKIQEDAGWLPAGHSEYLARKYPNYSPLLRYLVEGISEGGEDIAAAGRVQPSERNAASRLGSRAADKRLKGGHQETLDPVASLIKNGERGVVNAYANVALRDVLAFAEQSGWGRWTDDGSLANTVRVRVNGKDQYFQFVDPAKYRAAVGLVESPLVGGFAMRATKAASLMVREAATALSLSFVAVNPLRDMFLMALRPDKWMKGALAALGRGSLAKEYFKRGGGMAPFAVNELLPRGYTLTEKGMAPHEGIGNFEAGVQTMLRAVAKFGAWSENSSRLGIMARELDKSMAKMHGSGWKKRGHEPTAEQMNKAFAESQAVLNYSNHGASGVAQTMRATIPFFNAWIQTMESIPRRWKTGGAAERKRLAIAALGVGMGMTALEYYLNNRDERWRMRSQNDKYKNWTFFLGDKKFQVPKPPFLSLPSTMAGNFMEWASLHSPVAWDNALSGIGSTFEARVPSHPFFSEPLAQLTNTDFLTWAKIVPDAHARLETQDQFNQRTHGLSKLVGAVTGTSPERWDHAFRAFFASAGNDVMLVSEMLSDKVGNKGGKRHDWADFPGVAGYIKRDSIGSQAGFRKVADRFGELDAKYNSLLKRTSDAQESGQPVSLEQVNQMAGERALNLKDYYFTRQSAKMLFWLNNEAKQTSDRQKQAEYSSLAAKLSEKLLDEKFRQVFVNQILGSQDADEAFLRFEMQMKDPALRNSWLAWKQQQEMEAARDKIRGQLIDAEGMMQH